VTKKDTRTARLQKQIARFKAPSPEVKLLMSAFTKAAGTPASLSPATQKAFEAFGLDPADLKNWGTLLSIFAEVHFGEPAKSGPKRKWNEGAQCRLKVFAAVVRLKFPDAKGDDFIAKVKELGGYRTQSDDSIRRYLRGVPSLHRNN
jgi:hypothetical protein